MLLGEPPFDAETPLAILMKHINDPLPLPRQRDPSIPEPLERVVLKVLAKRPQDRYQTAEEMAGALRRAVEEAGIELPERVSLPLSFTTPAAPAESVAVLSGSAREKMRDAEFATEETDARLGQRLAAEAAAVAAEHAAGQAGQAVQEIKGASRQAAQRRLEAVEHRRRGWGRKALVWAEDSGSLLAVEHRWHGQKILNTVGLLVLGNLMAVSTGFVTGRWGIWSQGWPFELLLIGLLLAAIMEASGSIWLLIPAGIVLGNGYLMSFYAITGAWGLWAILWPLEPLLVGGTIWYTMRVASQGERARQVAVRLARRIRRPTLILALVVPLLGMILG